MGFIGVEKVGKYTWIDTYFLKKPGVEKNYRPEWKVFLFTIKKKFVAYASDLNGRPVLTLKGDPLQNDILRQKYKDITTGYHMNKDWWNTVYLDGTVPKKVIKEMMDISYDLILCGFPKKVQEEIKSS